MLNLLGSKGVGSDKQKVLVKLVLFKRYSFHLHFGLAGNSKLLLFYTILLGQLGSVNRESFFGKKTY